MFLRAVCERVSGAGLWWLWRKGRHVAVAAVVVVVSLKVRQIVQRRERRKRWAQAGKDVVVLHMFQRGRICPSLSPFVLKLETYLRMADIKYEVDFEEPMGYKQKCPWITLNGEDLADSQFIMEHLAAKFSKDFSSHLSPEEKAVAHAILILVEGGLLYVLAHWRYEVDEGRELLTGMQVPFIVRFAINSFTKKVKKFLEVQGIGRHTYKEVEHIGRSHLAALSAFLGDKDFMMGDKPTEVDCAVFGMLCQILFSTTGSPYTRMLKDDYTNLRDYVLRVRDKFWPDWNACRDPPVPYSHKI